MKNRANLSPCVSPLKLSLPPLSQSLNSNYNTKGAKCCKIPALNDANKNLLFPTTTALSPTLQDRISDCRLLSPNSNLPTQVIRNLIEQDVLDLINKLNNQGTSLSEYLISLCKSGKWIEVENLLDYTNEQNYDTQIVSSGAGWTPIMFAAKENQVEVVEKLIKKKFNINVQANDGATALHLACAHAREPMIRCLLGNKANPNLRGGVKHQLPIHILASKNTQLAYAGLQLLLKSSNRNTVIEPDGDGKIPLFISLESNAFTNAKELLQVNGREQVQMKCPPNDDTVLHLLTNKKKFSLFSLMYEYGANINAQNKLGKTPLHLVAETGEESIVRMFYMLGARADIVDINDKTPLHIATEKGYFRIVEYLIEKYKAPILTRTKDGDTLMHIASKSGPTEMAQIFMKNGIPLHMSNRKGAKAIHMAACAGLTDVVQSIIAKGEHVDTQTTDGHTPLHLAIENSKYEVVELLLGYGANAHLLTNDSGENALHIASKVMNGRISADYLFKSGAKVNSLTKFSEDTSLHIACRNGNISTVTLLLEEGAIPEIRNQYGETTLHVCVKECQFLITQQLIQHVLQKNGKTYCEKLVNQTNKIGETSLHYASNIILKSIHYPNEDRDMMRLLVQMGGDVMLGTIELQETPVHYCSKSGNINILNEIIGQLQPIDAQIACNKPSKNGWTPLLYASYYGHPDIIKILLGQNGRVDVFDDKGRAGLHLASEYGHEEVCDILLQNNAFVNVRNKAGLTPLHLTAKVGDNKLVHKLITQYGAYIDALTLNKQTPLHLAAENGQLEVCKTLLALKADINALDNLKQTPLHLAAQSDHANVVKLFLHAKPELVSVPNKNGFTCAHIAATKGSTAVLKELMKFNQETVLTARIKKTGSTAIHIAAEGGFVKVVKLLLQTGAKASDENLDGMTALHLAAKEGHFKIIQALKGALDWKICSRKTGLTALHVASSCGQMDCVSELLTQIPAGIKSERPLTDSKGDYGITPLHLACQNGHENVVRLLMNSAGVQVDVPTQVFNVIPMHLAAQGGHLLVAGLLISRSPDSLTISDKQGRNCLHFAAAYGQKNMVDLLLGQNAEINAVDNKLWTPLHYAARYGYLDVVQVLVESGADPTAASKTDQIPLSCAAQTGHYNVMTYLLNKEHDSSSLMEEKTFLMDLMNSAKIHDNKPLREFILFSEVPIQTAVKIARSFENLAVREKERAIDLKKAQKYCDQIAIDLLSISATNYNAGALLRSYDNQNTEFLDVLIELERKELVSQHAAQKYLTELWMGGLKWKTYKFILLFLSFLIFPLIWVLVSAPIRINRLHRIPIIKFMSYLTSHIFFIVLLTYTLVFPQTKLYEYTHMYPLWNEWLLYFWFIGLVISDFINPSDRTGLGVIRVCIQIVGFCAMFVHFCAFIFFVFIVDLNNEVWSTYRLDILYIRNQLLAVAMLLSFIEFLNFLTFHPIFGPWAVIIQELIQDLMKFLALLSIFLAGFTLHICAIYQPVYKDPNFWNNTIPPLGQEFIVPHKSIEMLFYALFGLVEPDNMPPMHLSPAFSKIIIKIVFGIYMTVTLIVLINLLIAMMSNTYQRIEDQSDIEWKFGRAKLIRNMNRTLSTPSPINLIIGIPALFYTKYKAARDPNKLKLNKHFYGKTMDNNSLARHWTDRRSSKISKISRMSRSTNITNVYGMSLTEVGFDESKPIIDVVNWKVIIKKYFEFVGIEQEKTNEPIKLDEGETQELEKYQL